MVAGLKALCSRTSPQAQQEEEEERDIQKAVLSCKRCHRPRLAEEKTVLVASPVVIHHYEPKHLLSYEHSLYAQEIRKERIGVFSMTVTFYVLCINVIFVFGVL